MKNALLALGWIVAAIAIAATGVAYSWGQRNAREAASLRSKVADTVDKVNDLTNRVERDTATIKALEDKAASLEKLAATPAAPGPTVETPEQIKARLGLTASAAGDSTAKTDDGAGFPFAKMFSGPQGKEMAKYSADMAVNMQFAQLFTDLHLPAEVEQQVREIISRNLAEQISAGMEAMQQKLPPDRLKQMPAAADAKLRDELSRVLNQQEMAEWDEYKATLPERMLNQSLDVQLNMFAAELTPENHEKIRQTLIEELLPTGAAQQATSGLPDRDILQAQRDAISRARDRLAPELDEQQLGILDRFVSQQAQMMDVVTRMMQPGKQQENTPK